MRSDKACADLINNANYKNRKIFDIYIKTREAVDLLKKAIQNYSIPKAPTPAHVKKSVSKADEERRKRVQRMRDPK